MEKIQNNSLTNIISSAINEALSNTHTSTIAKVTKIQDSTISVKPVFKRVIQGVEVELPEFAEVPIFTLQGGSNYRIMPIAIGDYALLIFSERCIDDWLVGGADNKKPREYRMHDYSDAIAIVGLNNITNAINIPVGFEEVKGDIEHTGDNTQTGNYYLTGDIEHTGNTTQTGDYDLTGNIEQSGNTTTTGNTTTANLIVTSTVTAPGNLTGVSGSFNTSDSNRQITVTNGIITNIT